jgi:hypothetical protein
MDEEVGVEMDTRRKPPTDHTDSKPDNLSVEEGIRQGLEDEKNGRLRPAIEFFAEFEARYPALKKDSSKPVSPVSCQWDERAS